MFCRPEGVVARATTSIENYLRSQHNFHHAIEPAASDPRIFVRLRQVPAAQACSVGIVGLSKCSVVVGRFGSTSLFFACAYRGQDGVGRMLWR